MKALPWLAVLIATWVTTGSGSFSCGISWWVLQHHPHTLQEIFPIPFSGLPSNLHQLVMCHPSAPPPGTQPLAEVISLQQVAGVPPGAPTCLPAVTGSTASTSPSAFSSGSLSWSFCHLKKFQQISCSPSNCPNSNQKEKGATEHEMVGWHHQLNRQESEQTPGDSEGLGGLVCCGPRGGKESHTTDWTTTTSLCVLPTSEDNWQAPQGVL